MSDYIKRFGLTLIIFSVVGCSSHKYVSNTQKNKDYKNYSGFVFDNSRHINDSISKGDHIKFRTYKDGAVLEVTTREGAVLKFYDNLNHDLKVDDFTIQLYKKGRVYSRYEGPLSTVSDVSMQEDFDKYLNILKQYTDKAHPKRSTK